MYKMGIRCLDQSGRSRVKPPPRLKVDGMKNTELRATRLLRTLGGSVKSRRQFVLQYRSGTDGRWPGAGKCQLDGHAYYAIDRAIAHGQIVMHEDGSIHLAKQERIP